MFLFEGGMAAAIPWYLSGGIAASACVAAYQPKGAASLAASYVNLTGNATYNAAPGTAPTWDAVNGWRFNGSSQYLKTGIIPVNDQTWSALIRWSDIVINSAAMFLFGASWGSGGFIIYIATNATPDNYVYFNGSSKTKTGARTESSGISAIAGTKAYFNGADEGLAISSAAGTNTFEIYIGTYNYLGSTYFVTSSLSKIQAFAVYNTVLTPDQVLAVTNAMNAL